MVRTDLLAPAKATNGWAMHRHLAICLENCDRATIVGV